MSLNTQPFRLFFSTWNVANEDPPENLEKLLKDDNFPDGYVIGLQELNSTALALVNDAMNDDPWSNAFSQYLFRRNYVRVSSLRLLGIHILVFMSRNRLPDISHVSTCYTRTGAGGMWGNKGAVSVRMDINGASVCFVNSHLAAHQHAVPERIEHFNTIIDSQVFKGKYGDETILLHDYVFWIGDLNFRIDNYSKDEIEKAVENKNYDKLIKHDQLTVCIRDGTIFAGFREGELTFNPSYKYDKGTNNYDTSKKQRLPAWCDRVLYHTQNPAYTDIPLSAKVQKYHSVDYYDVSDHKPVVATYVIQVPLPTQSPIDFQILGRWASGQDGEFCYRLHPSLLIPSSHDWIALYRANFRHLQDYVTYIWVPAPDDCARLADGRSLYSCTIREMYLHEEAGAYVLAYCQKGEHCPVAYSNTFVISVLDIHSETSSSSRRGSASSLSSTCSEDVIDGDGDGEDSDSGDDRKRGQQQLPTTSTATTPVSTTNSLNQH